MDAHLFRRFSEVCVPLLEGARLTKIQEPAEGVLTFNLDLFRKHPSFGKKSQLVLKAGRKDPFIFLSSFRTAAGGAPSAPVMRLRKYTAGHTIRHAFASWIDRELWLLMSGPIREGEEDAGEVSDGAVQLIWLVLSLREGAQLRFLAPGEEMQPSEPSWPEPRGIMDACFQWREWPVVTPALRRTLKGLDVGDSMALACDLEAGGGDLFLYREEGMDPRGRIRQLSAWPLSPDQSAGLIEEVREDVLEVVMEAGGELVMAEASRKAAQQAALPLARREKRLKGLLERQEEEERRLSAMCARKQDALLLQGSLWRWPQGFKASSVEVDDPSGSGEMLTVRLDARYTVRENMERGFHSARRGERGLVHVSKRRQELEEEIAEIGRRKEAVLLGAPVDAPKEASKGRVLPDQTQLPARVQLFISSDGFALLRGRDARGNQEVRRMASPHDIWVHAEGGPGSHVIIRRSHGGEEVPERTFDEAGSLAACRSWLREEPRARLTYCEVRHVRPLKGAAPGTMRMDKVMFTREVPVVAELEQSLAPEGKKA